MWSKNFLFSTCQDNSLWLNKRTIVPLITFESSVYLRYSFWSHLLFNSHVQALLLFFKDMKNHLVKCDFFIDWKLSLKSCKWKVFASKEQVKLVKSLIFSFLCENFLLALERMIVYSSFAISRLRFQFKAFFQKNLWELIAIRKFWRK